MNKKSILFPALLFISLLTPVFFSSCDKDTNCYLDVYVVEEGSRKAVSGAKIEITQEQGAIHDEGVTDAEGKYSTRFPAPAILTINATLVEDVENNGHRDGSTTVRTTDGETVSATVTLASEISYN